MRAVETRAGFFDVEDTGRPGPMVTALLVVRDEAGTGPVISLDDTCEALARQTRPPDRVVVVDATVGRLVRTYLEQHGTLRQAFSGLSVVTVPPDTPFAAVVDMAVDALPPPGEDHVVQRRSARRAGARPVRASDRTSWLWLLHEDSAPDVDALEELTEAASGSERVGIAGCKVVDAADPTMLLDIGSDITRTGRHVATVPPGTPDQGQLDHRRDALSVSSAGMLVRRDTYNTLGGFDPAFDGDGDGLDLGWRAHLIGHSVVVVPSARVRGRARADGSNIRTLRRHRQVALARSSLLGMPFLALWMAVSSTVLALFLLLAKRPRRAGVELVQASAPLGVLRVLRARGRFFRRATTRRRNLRGLFVTAGQAARAQLDAVRTGSIGGDGHGGIARAIFGPGGLVVLLLSVAAAVWWRDLLTDGSLTGAGQGLVGGQLLPFRTDAAGIWATYHDAWVGPGLGHASTPTPYLVVLAPLAWLVGLLPWVNPAASGAVAVAWILVAAMPLSGLAAYCCGRIITTERWPRAVIALLWATLPTLTTAVGQGRLGPAVGHILLPVALAGTLAAARRGATTATAFGAVLAVAATGAFAPVLLLACSIVALVGVVAARGAARWRQLAILITPWLLLGPWTRAAVTGDHRLLLAGPGALDDARGALARGWQLALVHPGGPGSYAVVATVPVLFIGVCGLLRPGLGMRGAALIGTGLLGLAAALAAPHVVLTATRAAVTGAATPWVGPALDVYAFALLAVGLMGIRGLTGGRARLWVRTGTAVACVGASVLGGFAIWTASPRATTPATNVLPSVVDEQLAASRAPRALVLSRTPGSGGAATLSYRLVGRESGVPARDLRRPDPAYDARTAAAVTALGAGAASATDLLHQLAVSYVVVRGAPADAQLNSTLIASGAVTQLSTTRDTALWRVVPISGDSGPVASSRLILTQAGLPATELSSTGAHGLATDVLRPGPPGRALVLAEGAGWIGRGRVTLDGRLLSASLAGGSPSYALPTTGGTLRVTPGAANRRLPWLQLVLLIAVCYLAIPFGSRKARV
ncbi:glycosyltransferase [Dermatophilaceae bacterium Sec6.4]